MMKSSKNGRKPVQVKSTKIIAAPIKRPKLSLAMICGNEEAHIFRCLSLFSKVCDEIIMVRAIGCKTPDKTLEIAETQFHAKTAIFENTEHPDWDHVEDFGRARQMSFDLATGEVVMWADCDDVMTNESLEAICEHLKDHSWGCIICRYDVQGTFYKDVMRERHFRRQADGKLPGRWTNPIHEQCNPPDNIVKKISEKVVFIHAPLAPKNASSQRNAKILRDRLENNGQRWFYLAQEQFIKGDKNAFSISCEAAFHSPDLGSVERYELCLQSSQIIENFDDSIKICMAAIALMPERREAYALAANLYIRAKKPQQAFTMAHICCNLPPIPYIVWTHQSRWHEWAHAHLYASCLRFLGKVKEAENVEDNLFMARGARISLIHATRGRAQQAVMCRNLWFKMAANPGGVEHIFAVDKDDEESKTLGACFRTVVVEPGSSVRAWNAAAEASKGHVLVQLSDDFSPCLNWDEIILKRLGNLKKSSVLAISDGHRKDSLLCMAIMTRDRYIQQGREMFSNEYQSVYSDTEFTHRAYKDGCVIDARDVVFTHHNPFFQTGKFDADKTYADSNTPARYKKGLATFKRRNPDAII